MIFIEEGSPASPIEILESEKVERGKTAIKKNIIFPSQNFYPA